MLLAVYTTAETERFKWKNDSQSDWRREVRVFIRHVTALDQRKVQKFLINESCIMTERWQEMLNTKTNLLKIEMVFHCCLLDGESLNSFIHSLRQNKKNECALFYYYMRYNTMKTSDFGNI